MTRAIIAVILVFGLGSPVWSQDPECEVEDLSEDCKDLIVSLGEAVQAYQESDNAWKTALNSVTAQNGRLKKRQEVADRLLRNHEELLRLADSTIVIFDEHGELLEDQVADFEKLSNVLYKTCVEPGVIPCTKKWKIYAAAIAGLVVGFAL